MAAFAYSAINIHGLETMGEIHAPDVESAREQLRIRGLLATASAFHDVRGEDSFVTTRYCTIFGTCSSAMGAP